jgi:hypothetical protein
LGRFVPRTRRARIVCGAAGAVVLIVFLLVPYVIGRIVRAQLAAMVADQLNAELRIGRFDYDAPYSVTVHDAALVAAGPDGKPVELLSVRQLDLTLARSPLRDGPLVIKELLIQDPSVRLIKTPDGLVGEKSLVKKPDGPEPPKRKLSEMFELRRISVARGQVVYEDLTRPGAVPLVWRGLQLDLGTQPQSPAVYAYRVIAGAAPIASLDAEGDMNIDDLVLNVAKCSIDATLRPDAAESPLPGELQQTLRQYGFDGKLKLSAAGVAPLRALHLAAFDGALELTGAKARLPRQVAGGVDVRQLGLNVGFKTTPADAPLLRVDLKTCDAETSAGSLQVRQGTVSWTGGRWTVEGLSGAVAFAADAKLGGYQPRGTVRFAASADGTSRNLTNYDVKLEARDASLAVPGFPERFEQLAGNARVNRDSAQFQDVAAKYGSNQVNLTRATVPLNSPDRHVRVEDIVASVDFGSPAPRYPSQVNDVLTSLGPIGVFNVSGSVDHADASTDYNLLVTSARGALAPTIHNCPTFFPTFKAAITPDAVDVSGIVIPAFGGTITGGLRLRPGTPTSYEGTFDVKNVELAEAKVLWLDADEPDQRLRGKTSGRVRVRGEIPGEGEKASALDTLRADGTIRVVNGYFYEVPVLREVSDWLRIPSGSVVGEAAATFAIQDRVVQLKRGVVSAPVLAVQGKGDVNFNGKLNLVVTAAAPFGQQAGGNRVVRDILGAVNKGLAAVGQWGLLEFQVTGDNDKPQLRPVAPAVNQTIDTVVGGIRSFAREAERR